MKIDFDQIIKNKWPPEEYGTDQFIKDCMKQACIEILDEAINRVGYYTDEDPEKAIQSIKEEL